MRPCLADEGVESGLAEVTGLAARSEVYVKRREDGSWARLSCQQKGDGTRFIRVRRTWAGPAPIMFDSALPQRGHVGWVQSNSTWQNKHFPLLLRPIWVDASWWMRMVHRLIIVWPSEGSPRHAVMMSTAEVT